MAAGIAAATAALLAAPAAASADEGVRAQSPTMLGSCAELTDQGIDEQGLHWAELRNDCTVEIEASVILSTGKRPTCVTLGPAPSTNIVTWKGEGEAQYAVTCI